VLRPAVFLDRDGTVAEEVGYLNHIERFRLFPFAGAAIRRLREAGFAVIVVTNQSGVGRGYFPESLVREVNQRMQRELDAQGAKLDGVYYCPHRSEDRCGCRKPGTGMMERAAREHCLDLRRSFVVGDRYLDMDMAFRAGSKGVFVRTGYGRGEELWHAKEWLRQPDATVDDLERAIDWILGQTR
jgi:D-glycero-D-manno-heptose 1,7-bisphosphate phosphatase